MSELNDDNGKYYIQYRVEGIDEVRHGLPIFIDRERAEDKAARLVRDIDVIIEAWAEPVDA